MDDSQHDGGRLYKARGPDGEAVWVDHEELWRLQQEANRRLAIVIPVTLLALFLLLFSSFNSLKNAVLILLNIPLALVGGVAANSRLREMLKTEAGRQGMHVHIPSIHLCGDNAAMIAAAGYHYMKAGIEAELGDDVYSRAK